MTRDVKCCSPDDTLEKAASIMWAHDLGCLPVVDDEGSPVAMITDRDVCMAAYTQGVALNASLVSSAMSKKLIKAQPDTPILELEGLMRDAQIRRMPVVGIAGQLIGIVTLGDLARHSQSKSVRKAVEGLGVAKTYAGIVERRAAARA